MKVIKVGLTCIVLMALLLGCSKETIQHTPIYQKTDEIKSAVNQEQWDKASDEIIRVNELYNRNKWKYQIMGDDKEYNSLIRHIKKLQVSIGEKDKKEANLNIAMIKQFVESIYFR